VTVWVDSWRRGVVGGIATAGFGHVAVVVGPGSETCLRFDSWTACRKGFQRRPTAFVTSLGRTDLWWEGECSSGMLLKSP